MVFKTVLIGFGFCFVAGNLFLSSAGMCAGKKPLPPVIVTTVINSDVQKVWNVMADFKNYGDWNRWVVKLEGEAKEGAKIRAYGKSGGSLDLQITSIREPNEICWVDITWFTRLGVGGWRCRRIEATSDNKVKFTNHFEYTGVFDGALDYLTREDLEKGMTLENESLRQYVEVN